MITWSSDKILYSSQMLHLDFKYSKLGVIFRVPSGGSINELCCQDMKLKVFRYKLLIVPGAYEIPICTLERPIHLSAYLPLSLIFLHLDVVLISIVQLSHNVFAFASKCATNVTYTRASQ